MRTIRLSLPLYRLYPLPITLFRIFYRPSSSMRLFRSRCFHSHPLTFLSSLSLSRILFQSHSLTLATHSRVGSGTRVSYEHSSRGNHRYCARGVGFQTNDVGGKTQTPFVVKSLRPTSTRVALRKIKIPLDRGGWHGKELLRSLGTRQSNSEGAIRGGSRRKREADPYRNRCIGDFDKHSRRTGAGNRRGVYTRGWRRRRRQPSLACSLLEIRGN